MLSSCFVLSYLRNPSFFLSFSLLLFVSFSWWRKCRNRRPRSSCRDFSVMFWQYHVLGTIPSAELLWSSLHPILVSIDLYTPDVALKFSYWCLTSRICQIILSFSTAYWKGSRQSNVMQQSYTTISVGCIEVRTQVQNALKFFDLRDELFGQKHCGMSWCSYPPLRWTSWMTFDCPHPSSFFVPPPLWRSFLFTYFWYPKVDYRFFLVSCLLVLIFQYRSKYHLVWYPLVLLYRPLRYNHTSTRHGITGLWSSHVEQCNPQYTLVRFLWSVGASCLLLAQRFQSWDSHPASPRRFCHHVVLPGSGCQSRPCLGLHFHRLKQYFLLLPLLCTVLLCINWAIVGRFYDELSVFFCKYVQLQWRHEDSVSCSKCPIPLYGSVVLLLVPLLCCRQSSVIHLPHRWDDVAASFFKSGDGVWQIRPSRFLSVCWMWKQVAVIPVVLPQKRRPVIQCVCELYAYGSCCL